MRVAKGQHFRSLDREVRDLSGFPSRPGAAACLWQCRRPQRAYSSVWLERTPDKREVGGSNPPRPTTWSELRSNGLLLTSAQGLTRFL